MGDTSPRTRCGSSAVRSAAYTKLFKGIPKNVVVELINVFVSIDMYSGSVKRNFAPNSTELRFKIGISDLAPEIIASILFSDIF